MDWSALVFIGEKTNNGEWRITRTPETNDLALLLFQSPHEKSTYQFIPLSHNEDPWIYFYNTNIQMTCQNQSLLVFEGDPELTEEQVFELMSSFALKDRNRIAFLRLFPNSKYRPKKRKTARIVSEEKPLY
ncbi:hypothetical protein [Neobacillus muris]|uniref:hypothetical protein n=1 Tax=Neobacillus muris TaxID=2941334 RepID=UPI00203FC361|nr:hypothetical protein [Neobacillus muris]